MWCMGLFWTCSWDDDDDDDDDEDDDEEEDDAPCWFESVPPAAVG